MGAVRLNPVYAATSHAHSASDIASGTLPQARGGTGAAALYKTVTGSASMSCAANSAASLTVGISVPSGYAPVAVSRVTSGSWRCGVTGFTVNGANVSVTIGNHTSTAASGTAYVTVLCLPTA